MSKMLLFRLGGQSWERGVRKTVCRREDDASTGRALEKSTFMKRGLGKLENMDSAGWILGLGLRMRADKFVAWHS